MDDLVPSEPPSIHQQIKGGAKALQGVKIDLSREKGPCFAQFTTPFRTACGLAPSRRSCRELPVPGVSQTRDDVPDLIQMTVERREIEWHVGKLLSHPFDTLWRRNEAEEFDPP